jgi:hypothetical protein
MMDRLLLLRKGLSKPLKICSSPACKSFVPFAFARGSYFVPWYVSSCCVIRIRGTFIPSLLPFHFLGRRDVLFFHLPVVFLEESIGSMGSLTGTSP